MDLDLSHIIVTALVVFFSVLAAERTSFVKDASRPKRAVTVGLIVFVVIFLLNLVWPEAGTAG